MLRALNYVRGSVRVEIEGAFPERFLNLCSQNGIGFWGLERPAPDIFRANMHVESYRRIAPFAKSAMCRIRIKEKNGLRFFLWRFRKRYALIAGLFLCMASIWALSLFIWDIEVTGTEKVPIDDILNTLAEEGVKIGAYVPGIDESAVKNRMLYRMGDLSWITVNIKGSRAFIEVRERIPIPEMIPKDIPCNIIAEKDGVIVKMDVLAGSSHALPGQTVKKGELLVSGIVDSSKIGARFVHSLADIRARTWYNLTAVSPAVSGGKDYTGKKTVRYAVIIGGKRYNLYFDTGIPYMNYDKITSRTDLVIPPDIPLPVGFVIEEYREYTVSEIILDKSELEERIGSALRGMIISEITGELSSEISTSSREENGLFYLNVQCEAEERIGKSVEIPPEG